MSDENATPAESTEALEPQHSVGEGQQVTDPAEDYKVDGPIPEPQDDVDVALQDGKDTQDGPGEGDVPPADFQGYADPSADPSADKQEGNS